ncbi:MAG: DUF1640 domain-containing protein [Boseongicola sp. SB0675_bin_26]|nr:DUF1640 domain-containing protein [Boseongicola sp. SB0675_bin_26]
MEATMRRSRIRGFRARSCRKDWRRFHARQGQERRLRSPVRECRRLSFTRCRGTPARHGIRGTIALAGRRRRHYDSLMSEAIAFDTHRFVKRLTDSGFTERQAETLAEEHVSLLNGNLATRADVERVRAEIAKVEARVEEAKSEILKWVFGALVAQGGLIVALVKLL